MAKGKSRYEMNKLVERVRSFGYVVRFEKGNFKSGYCILENKSVVIINKFHDVGARIDTLRLILAQIINRKEHIDIVAA